MPRWFAQQVSRLFLSPTSTSQKSKTPRNIVIVTGSSRFGGNSELLANAFVNGAESVGHSVSVFRCASQRIGACTACETCWSNGKACSINDGFDELAKLLEKADTLVLCSPLYFYSFSGHLKSAIDRMYAYSRPQRKRDLKIQEVVLLMCGGTWFKKSFAGAVASYRHILRYKKWKSRGIVLATRCSERGSISSHYLVQAEHIGKLL